MDKKDTQIFENLILESEYKTIEQLILRYIDKSVKLQEVLNRDDVPVHLKGLNKDTVLLKILSPSDIYAVLNIGLFISYKTNNMSVLNNALYTYNRLCYHRNLLIPSDTDHCQYLVNIIETYAGNDTDLVKNIFSYEKGLSVKGHKFSVTASNLIIALIYNNKEWIDKSIIQAEKFLTQENPEFDLLVLRYLIAIIQQKTLELTENLSKICNLYKKANFIHNFKNPVLKVIGLFVIGLYNLAFHHLPKNVFDKIIIPNHTIIWLDYINYCKKNHY